MGSGGGEGTSIWGAGSTRAGSTGLLCENQRTATRMTRPRTRKAMIKGSSGLRRGRREEGSGHAGNLRHLDLEMGWGGRFRHF